MNIEDLHNGFFRLTASAGVVDIRTGIVHSEAVVLASSIRFFKEVGV